MIDISGIIPELRPVAEKAAQVYVHHAAGDFVGLIAHGSAVKGGFIAGCSDIDFQLFLRDGAFTAEGHLPLERSVDLHRDLARIDPEPALYIQCLALGSALPARRVGPVPGAYRVIAGVVPIAEATVAELRGSAVEHLATLRDTSALVDGLLDHGEDRLARLVRGLCTWVWPALYELLIVQGAEPIATLNLPKTEALERLNPGSGAGRLIRDFDRAIQLSLTIDVGRALGRKRGWHGIIRKPPLQHEPAHEAPRSRSGVACPRPVLDRRPDLSAEVHKARLGACAL